MPLPNYQKKHRENYTPLPKGAYVVKILNAKVQPKNNKPGDNLVISFDIAEGEYTDYYKRDLDRRKRFNEDADWSRDSRIYLPIPDDTSPPFIWDKYNEFFTNVEESNANFIFTGNPAHLKGLVFGGKMRIEQSLSNGNVYDHTVLAWTCVADDVRNGKAGKLPNDKLITSSPAAAPAIKTDSDGFMQVADSVDEEVPWV